MIIKLNNLKRKPCIAKVGAVQDLESFEVVSHLRLPESL